MKNFGPSRCPRCDERQNTMPGGFDPDAKPFGRVVCMGCGHAFTRDEYLAGLDSPAPTDDDNVVPFPAGRKN